jgi:hypothetical protein
MKLLAVEKINNILKKSWIFLKGIVDVVTDCAELVLF